MARHGIAFLHRSDLSGSCLSAHGPTRSRNRPVRTRTPGGVGAGRLKTLGYPILSCVRLAYRPFHGKFAMRGHAIL